MVLRPSYAAVRKKNTPSITACLRVVHALYSMRARPQFCDMGSRRKSGVFARPWAGQPAEYDRSTEAENFAPNVRAMSAPNHHSGTTTTTTFPPDYHTFLLLNAIVCNGLRQSVSRL